MLLRIILKSNTLNATTTTVTVGMVMPSNEVISDPRRFVLVF
jgi:hypothetical protein